MNKKGFSLTVSLLLLLVGVQPVFSQASLKELLSYPNPTSLCSAPNSDHLAWVFNKEGKRNIYFSKDGGENYKALTHYKKDNGLQISKMQFSPDGKWLVYMRGGAPHGNWSRGTRVNPASSPVRQKFQLWGMRVSDGKAMVLVNSPYSYWPAISPNSKKVAFVKGGKVWTAPIDGSRKARRLFYTRGTCSYLTWSPDGEKLAFIAKRGDHYFIGVYTDNKTPIQWIAPSFAKDISPVWSPDSKSIVFIRRPGSGGAPDSILKRSIRPWEIRVADLATPNSSKLVWKAPHTFNGSRPTTNGTYNLHWAANNRIVFLATLDNWPHLYSIPVTGGEPLLLTPGNFMTEYIELSPDRKQLLFCANTGPDPKLDIDRRHIFTVSVDKPDMKILTPGNELEVMPKYLKDGKIAYISSTMYRPVMPAVLDVNKKNVEEKLIGKSLLSSHFNKKDIVPPEQVTFKAPDGTILHGQLYRKPGGPAKKPAVVCLHGGPSRQITLGWNYNDYYAAHGATNQVLLDMGFVVLKVNYRLGIGYGNEFHHPENGGRHGVSEYQDVLAAGKWLAKQSYVDADRIGIYGGSYGGYLTAFALGRNSDVFTAGVDISGVHTRVPSKRFTTPYEHAPDAALADDTYWEASPIADVDTWTSPVLIIHSDDDRNVGFSHSVDLVQRLKKKGVDFETLVIPNDTHHWIRFENLERVYEATIDFLNRKVKQKK